MQNPTASTAQVPTAYEFGGKYYPTANAGVAAYLDTWLATSSPFVGTLWAPIPREALSRIIGDLMFDALHDRTTLPPYATLKIIAAEMWGAVERRNALMRKSSN